MIATNRTPAVLAASVLLAACAGSSGGPPASSTGATPTSPPPTATVAAATPTSWSGSVEPGEPWIAYGWWLPDHEETDLFLVRPDGSDAHPIATDIPGEHRGPAWSPDGARLAFVIRGDDTPAPNGGIWLSDPDGSNATPLFDATRRCPDGAFHPAWSPDGTRLSITCYVNGASTIQVVDLVTLEMTEIVAVTWPEFLDNPASWSPDGTRLAFDILHWDPTDTFVDGSLLAVASSAGVGDVRRITEFASFAAYPAWHPADDRIAFNTYDLGAMKLVPEIAGLFTIAPDGSDLEPLALPTDTSVRLARPAWSEDGVSLLANLAHGNPVGWAEIVVVSAATGTWSRLATPTMGAGPKLRPRK